MYKVIGVDEAGKGPVLGSMFIGFSIINLKSLKELNSYQKMLKDMGVRDSKELDSLKRNQVYNKFLKSDMDMKYVQLTPILIDENHAKGESLNELEVCSIVKILEDEKPQLVIIDALTSNPKKFGDEILRRLSFECKIISENKADRKYEIVGAASIIAKELREQELKEIKNNVKFDCGSGYPSDPKTIEFLKKHYNNSEFGFIFRKCWNTYKRIANEKEQKSLSDF